MNLDLRQMADGVYASSRAAMLVEVADVMVFDMDGVLMDVHHSYPVVICQTVDQFLRELGFGGDAAAVTPEETAYFKAAGGFNSDWTLAQGLVLIYLVKSDLAGSRHVDGLRQIAPDLVTVARACGQYGGGLPGLNTALSQLVDGPQMERIAAEWDRERITRLAQEFYAGDEAATVFGVSNHTVTGEGLMRRERPLIHADDLKQAALRYGLYTGRNQGEVQMAIQMAGLTGIFDDRAMITESLGIHKPNPEGLFRIQRALSPRLMIYAGDNLDDWQTAARYEAERRLDAPPCLFCGVLGGSPGPLSYGLFQERGVDLMAASVRSLIAWIVERQRQLTRS